MRETSIFSRSIGQACAINSTENRECSPSDRNEGLFGAEREKRTEGIVALEMTADGVQCCV